MQTQIQNMLIIALAGIVLTLRVRRSLINYGHRRMVAKYHQLYDSIEDMHWSEANQEIADFHALYDLYPECNEMAAELRSVLHPMGYESGGMNKY